MATIKVVLSLCLLAAVVAPVAEAALSFSWEGATANMWYGQNSQGSCGYGNTLRSIYSTSTASVSGAYYDNGASCGGCVLVQCTGSRFCKSKRTVLLTITNSCTSPNKTSACYKDRKSVSLTPQAWSQIVTNTNVGLIPVQVRRAPCIRKGGIQITVMSWASRYYLAFLLRNVGGPGDLRKVEYRSAATEAWTPMLRNYGSVWALAGKDFLGKPVSLRLTGGISPLTIEINNALPANWKPGQVYASKVNYLNQF